MEFEKNAPVSDEQRRLAEAKKVTIQPAHTDITPEDISESEIANSHINGQPIGNTRNDIEQDAPVLHQSNETSEPILPETRKQSLLILGITVGAGVLIIAASLFVAYQL